MYTYVCPIFVLLPTFLFVRALFRKTASTRTHDSRPETMVEVSVRSMHSGERDTRLKLFRREWIRRFPCFRFERISFVITNRKNVVRFLHTRYTTDNRRSHRSNAAAHSPCVCDTPICAVLRSLVVIGGACCPYFTVCLSRYHIEGFPVKF